MTSPRPAWRPTTIRRFIKNLDSGAGTVLVLTDQGDGYLKAMGNPGGEPILACEWVGTQLANWFGLSTFDFCLIDVTDEIDIPFFKRGQAKPGRAFITRAEPGNWWGGKERELRKLINPQDISRLVVFDTWTLNCDRHSLKENGKWRINRDNVYFSATAPKGKLLLKAMDHTHCFTCGRELTSRIASIDRVRDANVYGLFPEFRPFLDRAVVKRCVNRLNALKRETVEKATESIPSEWDVSQTARRALTDLIMARAAYVGGTIMRLLWPQDDLPFKG